MSEIDTSNECMVSVQNNDIVFLMLPRRLSKERALVLAAWIIALADPLNESFPEIKNAVENT